MMIPIIIHRLPFEKDHQSTSIVLYAVRCAQSSKNGGCPFWISLKNSHPCTKRVKGFSLSDTSKKHPASTRKS